MKFILVIINGISLPYHVIDYAVDNAQKNSCGIYVLFLEGTRKSIPGYGFPSDLRQAETLTADADAAQEEEEIILQNRELLKKIVEAKKIAYRAAIKTNTSLDDVIALAATAEMIVIDEDFDKVFLLSDPHISVNDLINESGKPVYMVPKV